MEASITEISTYPDENSNAWGGDGNPNVSYYPYTAYIENTEGLRNGEYVGLTMTATGGEDQENKIYLEKAYIRDEDGKTGKTIWGSYAEIVEGLTKEDRIAFPYGKSAKEGVKVKDESE